MTSVIKEPRIVPAQRNKKLFCFGYGYTASFLATRLRPFGWEIAGTTSDPEKYDAMLNDGIEAVMFDDEESQILEPGLVLRGVTHILLSVPPNSGGDPVFALHGMDLTLIPGLEWVGYLSTTGIYGDREGAWVDESSLPAPTSRRGDLRLRAEQQWLSLYQYDQLPLHIFRLSGIYGPGRSAIDSVRAGTARRIEKEGHVFNRIHVDDIVETLVASINKPAPGRAYNLSDDLPSASHEVIGYACELLGMRPIPCVPFDQIDMAPIVRSFYKECKRVSNARIKDELGVELLYPDYKSGLKACFELEAQAMSFLNFNDGDTQRRH